MLSTVAYTTKVIFIGILLSTFSIVSESKCFLSCVFFQVIKFFLLSPSERPLVLPFLCIRFIPQLFSIVGIIIIYQLFHLYPSIFSIRCQIIMHLSYFPALSSLISLDLCTPAFDFRFCFLYHFDPLPLDPFCFSTSDYGLPFCSVAVIGLISGFNPLRVTPLMIWIVFIITVCWNYDPVYKLSLCYWITCITLICTCKTRFCLTLLKENKDSLFIIVVLAFGSSSASPDSISLSGTG